MASSPELLAAVDCKLVREGAVTPYHLNDFVGVSEIHNPATARAIALAKSILDPELDIKVEGVNVHHNLSAKQKFYCLSLYGAKMPLFGLRLFGLGEQRVELTHLFNPDSASVQNDQYRYDHKSLNLRSADVTVADDWSSYILEEQAKEGVIEEDQIPVVLQKVKAEPFRYIRYGEDKGEDIHRALIRLTTQDALAYLRQLQDEDLSKTNEQLSRLREQQTEIEIAISELLRSQKARSQKLYAAYDVFRDKKNKLSLDELGFPHP